MTYWIVNNVPQIVRKCILVTDVCLQSVNTFQHTNDRTIPNFEACIASLEPRISRSQDGERHTMQITPKTIKLKNSSGRNSLCSRPAITPEVGTFVVKLNQPWDPHEGGKAPFQQRQGSSDVSIEQALVALAETLERPILLLHRCNS